MGSITLTPGAAPGSPAEGEIYYDSTADKLKVRNASAFESVASGAGAIIQVVQSSYTTHWEQVMNGSTPEYINNGVEDLNVTITPASSSNKVFLTFSFGAYAPHSSGSGMGLACAIDRNGTLIGINTGSDTAVPKVSFVLHMVNMDYGAKGTSYTYLDSPSTTSACVYKIKCTAHSSSNWTTRWNRTQTTTTASAGYGGVCVTNFTAMEVQG